MLTRGVVPQEDLLRQLLTDSKAYGSLLGSGGVGDSGRNAQDHAFNRWLPVKCHGSISGSLLQEHELQIQKAMKWLRVFGHASCSYIHSRCLQNSAPLSICS